MKIRHLEISNKLAFIVLVLAMLVTAAVYLVIDKNDLNNTRIHKYRVTLSDINGAQATLLVRMNPDKPLYPNFENIFQIRLVNLTGQKIPFAGEDFVLLNSPRNGLRICSNNSDRQCYAVDFDAKLASIVNKNPTATEIGISIDDRGLSGRFN